MAENSEYSHSGLALFAAELQAARAKAGLSQDELAGRINYSPSTVAMIENLKRVPRPEFAERCDQALGTTGTFARLQQHARTTALPSWFRQYAEIEAAASQLRLFEHAVIPGLLQTEAYARSVLASLPNTSEETVEQRVTARLGRQDILDGDDPPRLWVVIDEAVLHRQVHGAAVMSEQLWHLAEMSLRPNVIIEVLPFDAEAYYSLLGAFAIADIGDGSRVAYLETVIEGYVVENPSVVADIMYLFDSLRSETLSPGRSRDLIMKRAEKYGPDQDGLA
jgi:transcriptional regulator with XRE-family HTH domain